MTKKKPVKQIAKKSTPTTIARARMKALEQLAKPAKPATIAAPKTAEKNLWAWLCVAAMHVTERTKLHWQRIENAIKSGVLDVEGVYDGAAFWLELKSIAGGKTLTEKLNTGLTTAQAMFMRARILAGGKAWLLIEISRDSTHERYLVYGSHAVELSKPITEARIKKLSTPLMDDTALEVLLAVAGQ